MGFVKRHLILILFILGAILRLTLLFLDHSFDVNNHIAWGKDLYQRGIKDFYDTRSSEVYSYPFPNYPPISIYLFFLIFPLRNFLLNLLWPLNVAFPLFPSAIVAFIDTRMFETGLFKIPGVIADLGIGLVTYLFAQKIFPGKKQVHILAVLFTVFNPVLFYNSAYWGQIDTIPIFLVLSSFYAVMYTNRFYVSFVLFTIALLVKPTVIIFLFPYSIYFIHKYKWMKFLQASLTALLVFWLCYLPFYNQSHIIFFPFQNYYEKIILTQSLPYVTNGAFNFWGVITQFKGVLDSATWILNISFRTWGYIFFGLLSSIICWLSFQKKNKEDALVESAFMISLTAVLFLTKMHERYYILILPFLTVMALKQPRVRKLLLVFTIIGFLNMYHSWPIPTIQPLLTLIQYLPIKISISLVSLVIYLFLLRKLILEKNA